MSKTGDSQAGYTLVELLVVLAIIALLTGAIPLLLTSGRRTVETRTAVHDLARAMLTARQTAMARNRETNLTFDNRAHVMRIFPSGRSYAFAQGVSVSLAGARRNNFASVIRFFPDGSSSGGTVTVRGFGRPYRVTALRLTGQAVIDE